MDQKQIHEKATEVLARIMDLSYEEAMNTINEECGDSPELKESVIDLYKEICEEDQRIEEKKKSKKWSGFTRIGKPFYNTEVLGKWTKALIGKKSNRLIAMMSIFLILLAVGFLVRDGYKKRILQAEEEEFRALIKTQSHSLIQWIEREKNITNALATSKVILPIAVLLDSLAEASDDYSALRTSSQLEPVLSELNRIRNSLNLEALGIVNKRDPVYMVMTEEASDGSDNKFNQLRIGKSMYEYFLQMKEGEPVYVPPMHDTERFVEIPENLNEGTYTTFSSPIIVDDEIIGYLVNEFNAENTFSEILGSATHGKTTELYAFDMQGRMASRSRFQSELQKTVLLDFDSTKSSIFNIELKDPGHDITKNEYPKIPKINQDFTELVTIALSHISNEDAVLEGAIMEPYRDYRGIEVVGAWMWLPEYGHGCLHQRVSRFEYNSKSSFSKFG